MNNPENVQPPEQPMDVNEGEIFGNQPDWLDELVANHNWEDIMEGNVIVEEIHVQTIPNQKRG